MLFLSHKLFHLLISSALIPTLVTSLFTNGSIYHVFVIHVLILYVIVIAGIIRSTTFYYRLFNLINFFWVSNLVVLIVKRYWLIGKTTSLLRNSTTGGKR